MIHVIRLAALALAAPVLAQCAPVNSASSAALAHPEATPFDAEDDAALALAAAEAEAAAANKLLLAVFGANWCHDSRAFAGWMGTDRFRALIDQHYVVQYVDVGRPQKGEGRNLELAEAFGVTAIEGTPTVIVVSRDGAVLNADTAKSWRNAASRSEDEIFAELAGYAAR